MKWSRLQRRGLLDTITMIKLTSKLNTFSRILRILLANRTRDDLNKLHGMGSMAIGLIQFVSHSFTGRNSRRPLANRFLHKIRCSDYDSMTITS